MIVILKRASLDGLMKNLERLERDSSEAEARSKIENDEKKKAPSGRELSPKATEGECLV